MYFVLREGAKAAAFLPELRSVEGAELKELEAEDRAQRLLFVIVVNRWSMVVSFVSYLVVFCLRVRRRFRSAVVLPSETVCMYLEFAGFLAYCVGLNVLTPELAGGAKLSRAQREAFSLLYGGFWIPTFVLPVVALLMSFMEKAATNTKLKNVLSVVTSVTQSTIPAAIVYGAVVDAASLLVAQMAGIFVFPLSVAVLLVLQWRAVSAQPMPGGGQRTGAHALMLCKILLDFLAAAWLGFIVYETRPRPI
jgi:hypothetical protein